MMKQLGNIFLICSLFIHFSKSRFVSTPCGQRLPECIVQTPHHETKILSFGETSEILFQSPAGHHLHKVPEICRTKESWGPSNYTCNSLPCNNWMDNAGWQSSDLNITLRGFAADYTVPPNPLSGSGGQTLFYFLGIENTDGLGRHGPNRVILQPVLTWGNGIPDQWYIQSWACCPQGMTVSSPPIGNLPVGSVLNTFVNQTSDTEAVVVSTAVLETNTSLTTTLSIYLNGPPYYENRYFNWADLTLEVYSVGDCSEMSQGTMTFSNMKLWDDKYQDISMDIPTWVLTPSRPCSGKTTVVDDTTITISHSP